MNYMAPFFPRDLYHPFLALQQRAATHHDVHSTVKKDKDKYQVTLDVHQFLPHEIVVKASGDYILVEGKHEEKEDEHGYISRHFVRKYKLPHDHDSDDVVSSLSAEGILSITAPRKNPNAIHEGRIVPIHVMAPAYRPAIQPEDPRNRGNQQMDVQVQHK